MSYEVYALKYAHHARLSEDAHRVAGAGVGREPLLRQPGADAALADRLVGRPALVPGHDPLVFERYPAPSKELQGIVVRLD